MRPWQILHANDPALRITGGWRLVVLSQCSSMFEKVFTQMRT